MRELVICDTSCLIIFDKLNLLHLLQHLYDRVYVTPEIEKEFLRPLPKWINIKSGFNFSLQQTLIELVDEGEASAIALAFDLTEAVLI